MSCEYRVFLNSDGEEPSRQVAAMVKVAYLETVDGLKRTKCELADPTADDDNTLASLLAPEGNAAIHKALCDVVVQGSACAPRGEKRPAMDLTLKIGTKRKRIRAFGPRSAVIRNGEAYISQPEPVDSVPMNWDVAYGGTDEEVTSPAPTDFAELLRARTSHPGRFPRNPYGAGYIVGHQDRDAFRMPQLEDPNDLLTTERLITPSPEEWFTMPSPAGWSTPSPSFFPRRTFMGGDAWFPPPEDHTLPEIAKGVLPHNYRTEPPAEEARSPRFLQLAVPDLSFERLPAGTEIEVTGMHPEHQRQVFVIPPAPKATWSVEGRQFSASLRPLTVHLNPTEQRLEILYECHAEVSRGFIPEIHRKVPAALSVEGLPFVECFMPTPALDLMKQLEAEKARRDEKEALTKGAL